FLRQTKPNRLLHEFSGFSIILWGISVFIFQLLYKLDFFVTAYIIGGLSVICLFTMIAIYYFVNLSEDIQKKRAEIQYLNIHDPLTNLYNRMYFDSLTKSNIDPFRLPVSIIVADVNGLKIVNDCFGHYEGDKLITYVSKILLQSCNDNSYIFRWGGDEFVIILPETKQNQAQLVLNNIKNNISQSPPLLVPLTIALGLSVKTSPNQTYTELYQNAEKAMYNNKMTEWQNNQLETIDYLNTYLFNEDIEKKAHNDRVITLTKELGVKLQLSDYALCRIMNVAKFHDIGKITIPKEILKKRGKLTKEEWAILKTYPEIGYRITRSSGEYASIANAILHIQEWWNGSGYPYSLSGKDIPFFSRIIAVVNTYDIMTHDQPYRKALSSDIALKEMKKLSEIQFDPEILTTFFKIVQS
ncbi:MAG: HD domain-containing phosphohydrolase, partial [Eubacteriales bacterium]